MGRLKLTVLVYVGLRVEELVEICHLYKALLFLNCAQIYKSTYLMLESH